MVLQFFVPEWGGFRSGIRFHDIIVAVNDNPVTSSDEVMSFVDANEPGTPLTYTIKRGKDEFQKTIPTSLFTLKDYLTFFPVMILLGLAFYIIGPVVFYIKPNSRQSWALLSYCVMPGLLIATGPAFCTIHLHFFLWICAPLAGPTLLIFALLFPVENKYRKYIIPLLLISAIPIIFSFFYYSQNPFIYIHINNILMAYISLTTTLALLLMTYSFVTSPDTLIRQKGKIVLYGFVIAFLGTVIGMIFQSYYKAVNLYVLNLLAITGFMLPLSFGYAIVKHNLFDVDVIIRRSLSYLLVSAIVVILFFASLGIINTLLKLITGRPSQVAAVFSTLLTVVIFRPIRDRVERRFFRGKYEYQDTIRKASGILVSIIDLEELLQQLLDTVLEAIKIERGVILQRGEEPEGFQVVMVSGYEESGIERGLSFDHPIVLHLETRGKSVQINDIEEFEEFSERRESMLSFMRELRIVLLIPIIYERRLIGILGLGEKKSGAWYSSEDIDLLQTLMIQTAVSIENARKIEKLKKMVELETSYRELKRLDEMKDNFLSMVSHDLRTPMTSVRGYASILLEKLGRLGEDRQRRYLNIIKTESDRLTRLISDLLDLQRFEAGKMDLIFEDLDLLDIVRQSVDSFQGAALPKNITLEKELPEDTVMVRGDADRLSQVIANLLSNAIKFTSEEGLVKISVEKLSENEKPEIKVSVSDTGIGIPRDKQSNLFDKFQQVEHLVRKKQEGSGLGLALVREIVEHHGGKVGVESEPGRGSTFYFILQFKSEKG